MKLTKVCLFLSLFLLSCQAIYTQNFIDETAIWAYIDLTRHERGVNIVKFEKDTLIGDRNTKKFKVMRAPLFGPSSNITFDTANVILWHLIYYHEIDSLVEFSLDGVLFDTLYNFKANIGDSWTVTHPNNSSRKVKITVNEVYEVVINGVPLMAQRLLYNGINDNLLSIQIVYQRIGNLYDYIIPWDFIKISLDGGWGGPVRCYSDDVLGFADLGIPPWWNPNASWYWHFECTAMDFPILPTEEIQQEASIKLFPNPARNFFELDNNKEYQELSILNLLGQSVYTTKIKKGTNRINITNLENGVYFIVLDQRYSKKIIKSD